MPIMQLKNISNRALKWRRSKTEEDQQVRNLEFLKKRSIKGNNFHYYVYCLKTKKGLMCKNSNKEMTSAKKIKPNK